MGGPGTDVGCARLWGKPSVSSVGTADCTDHAQEVPFLHALRLHHPAFLLPTFDPKAPSVQQEHRPTFPSLVAVLKCLRKPSIWHSTLHSTRQLLHCGPHLSAVFPDHEAAALENRKTDISWNRCSVIKDIVCCVYSRVSHSHMFEAFSSDPGSPKLKQVWHLAF